MAENLTTTITGTIKAAKTTVAGEVGQALRAQSGRGEQVFAWLSVVGFGGLLVLAVAVALLLVARGF